MTMLTELTKLLQSREAYLDSKTVVKDKKAELRVLERSSKEKREVYLQNLLKVCESPIRVQDFLDELKRELFEEDIACELNFCNYSYIDLPASQDYFKIKFIDNGNDFIWSKQDELSERERVRFFFNDSENKIAFNLLILMRGKRIASIKLPLTIDQPFSNGKTLLEHLKTEYTLVESHTKLAYIKACFDVEDLEQMMFIMPKKYVCAHERIGAGILPETLQNMLLNIYSKKADTKSAACIDK